MKLGSIFKSIGKAFTRAVRYSREQLERFANAVKKDKTAGELELHRWFLPSLSPVIRVSPQRSARGPLVQSW